MVGFGLKKYRMARKNPDTNSDRNSARAAWSSFIMSSLRRETAELQHRSDDHHHGERERQKDFPAKPHQLVVAIARHNRLRHREQEEQEQRLEREPDDAGYPGEWRDRYGWKPSAQEQDRP